MELTAPAVFELGLVILLAAFAGWIARAAGFPAVIGYLAVGLAISPFTPGYVADRGQLAFLADLGVVLLLFEVGIEIDVERIRRDHGPIVWLAPLQVFITGGVSLAVLVVAGVPPLGAALVALGLAMSSSVVIVNTRSSAASAGWPCSLSCSSRRSRSLWRPSRRRPAWPRTGASWASGSARSASSASCSLRPARRSA